MGHPTGQVSDCLHLLRLPQQQFQLGPLCLAPAAIQGDRGKSGRLLYQADFFISGNRWLVMVDGKGAEQLAG